MATSSEQLRTRTYSRRSLHGQVAHEIAKRIMRGDFAPGQSLPSEAELSLELDVSRTALREAKKLLAGKGLVDSRPKLGTRVRPRGEWNMLDPDILAWHAAAAPIDRMAHDLFEVRRMVEPYASGLAAKRANATQIATIAVALDDMVAAGDDVEASIEPDARFHQAILEGTNNELLVAMGAVIEASLMSSIRISSSLPGARLASLPLHENVLVAIRAGKAKAATRAMTVLLEGAIADIRQVLKGSAKTEQEMVG
ncbi:MAG: FadR/GntR family transcriptional regulator [Pseudomonadota bacterium]